MRKTTREATISQVISDLDRKGFGIRFAGYKPTENEFIPGAPFYLVTHEEKGGAMRDEAGLRSLLSGQDSWFCR